MGSSCLVRRSWTQASRILARVTIVEAWGAAVAVGEKVGARMVAKARNAMAARREQGNSGDLAGGVEGTFMAAPINRNLLFDFKRRADVTPIPLFADSVGWDRLLNSVAHPLAFRFFQGACGEHDQTMRPGGTPWMAGTGPSRWPVLSRTLPTLLYPS